MSLDEVQPTSPVDDVLIGHSNTVHYTASPNTQRSRT
jgi:hypothetical protein